MQRRDGDELPEVEAMRNRLIVGQIAVPADLVERTMKRIDRALEPLWRRIVFFRVMDPAVRLATAAALFIGMCGLFHYHEITAPRVEKVEAHLFGAGAVDRFAMMGDAIFRRIPRTEAAPEVQDSEPQR